MKYIVVLLILAFVFLLAFVFPVMAKTCGECPKDNPCSYTYLDRDGCNTCLGSTWCENGHWYTDQSAGAWCTTMYCSKTVEVENPFLGGITK